MVYDMIYSVVPWYDRYDFVPLYDRYKFVDLWSVLYLGSNCVGAHLLSDVIDNIQQQADYYQKRTLCYSLKENDLLYKLYDEAGRTGQIPE